MMAIKSIVFCLTLAIVTYNSPLVCAQDQVYLDKITVNIDSSVPQTNNLYKKYVNMKDNNGYVQMNISGEPAFFVIQVHTFGRLVTLSTNRNITNTSDSTYVTGSNIGLVQHVYKDVTSYDFYMADDLVSEKMLIVVNAYDEEDPVPGGCNLTFNVEEAPYQLVTFDKDMIRVDAAQPSAPGRLCESQVVKLEMYHMYIDIGLDVEAHYYESIEQMLTVKDVYMHGSKTNRPLSSSTLRRFYTNYHGEGVVYAAIAIWGNRSSTYVPVVSYGCDVNETECYNRILFRRDLGVYDVLILIIGGVMACFDKSWSYLLTLINMTCISVVVLEITSLHIPIATWYFLPPFLLIATLLFILAIKLKCCDVINAVMAGYLFALFIFLIMPFRDDSLFQMDWMYWSALVIVTLVSAGFFDLSGIPSMTITSFFFLSVSMSRFSGGVVCYMVINNFRRMTVPNFNQAIIDPPLVISDISITVVAFIYCTLACVIAWRIRTRQLVIDETSPLLAIDQLY